MWAQATKQMQCVNCDSLWELKIKNPPSAKPGQYFINPKGLSITPKCVEIMKKTGAFNKIRKEKVLENHQSPSTSILPSADNCQEEKSPT